MEWRRPDDDEMAGYFIRYSNLVQEADIIAVLKDAKKTSRKLMFSLSFDEWDYRYAEDKWSVKEVWLHIIDTERIFAYRALRFGRGDQTPLSGFEQNNYISPSKAPERSIASIIHEYETVRDATISLFEYMPPEALDRTGTASGNKLSARALAFIIAGHERHHVNGLLVNYGVRVEGSVSRIS